jgi:hypothetical protein
MIENKGCFGFVSRLFRKTGFLKQSGGHSGFLSNIHHTKNPALKKTVEDTRVLCWNFSVSVCKMEGFLLKKGRGESKYFGRRNWKKRWFILDGQYLTYYEDFDRVKNTPLKKKVALWPNSRVYPLRNLRVSQLLGGVKLLKFLTKIKSTALWSNMLIDSLYFSVPKKKKLCSVRIYGSDNLPLIYYYQCGWKLSKVRLWVTVANPQWISTNTLTP